MTLLSKIKRAGFQVTLTETGNLAVTPASKLTQSQFEFLRSNKARIIEELKSSVEWIEYVEPDSNDQMTVTCYTPSGGKILVKADSETHRVFLMAWNPSTAH